MACAPSISNDLGDRQHRPERIGDLCERDHSRPFIEQGCEARNIQLARRSEGRGHQPGSARRAGHLPGHNVGVVLEVGDQHLIASSQVRMTPGLSHQVDGFGGTARKDDLAGRARIDKAAHGFTRAFKSARGCLAETMYAAVHIGMRGGGVGIDRIEHGAWLLRRGGTVQVHQRLTVQFAPQDRKIGAHAFRDQCALAIQIVIVREWLPGVHCNSSGAGAALRRAAARRCASRRNAAGSTDLSTSPRNAQCSSARASSGRRPRDNR